MNMELNTYIPNNDSNWIVKNDVLYYNKYCNIPMLIKTDGIIWIVLDLRSIKSVLLLTKFLFKNNIKFYYTTRDILDTSNLNDDYCNDIITNYLNALKNETFFDGINKIGFDYICNLTEFMLDYKCIHNFNDVYVKIKTNFLRSNYDYYSKTNVFNIKRIDIREYVSSIEREMKLNMLL